MPTPVGPRNRKLPTGRRGILDAAAAAQDRLGDEGDRLVLADHAPVQDLLEAQELLLLALDEPGDGDPRPLGHDFRDLLLGNLLLEERGGAARLLEALQLGLELGNPAVAELGDLVQVVGALGLLHLEPGRLEVLAQLAHAPDRGLLLLPLELQGLGLLAHLGEFLAQGVQAALAGLVLLLGEGRLLDLQLERAAGELVELLRHRVHLGADHGAGLVHQVDRLVRAGSGR